MLFHLSSTLCQAFHHDKARRVADCVIIWIKSKSTAFFIIGDVKSYSDVLYTVIMNTERKSWAMNKLSVSSFETFELLRKSIPQGTSMLKNIPPYRVLL